MAEASQGILSRMATGGFESLASTMTKTATPKSTKAPREIAGDPLGVEDDVGESKTLDGVAAQLHMQDLMNHHAQKALAQQSKRVKRGISRFRQLLREITGMVVFDLMIGGLVLIDTACIILQQEWYNEVNQHLDSTEIFLRGVSVAITTAFAVEFTARCLAQVGLGWSWMLLLDGFIVLASFVEVVVYSIDPNNAAALRLLRPLRALRLLRAARGCVRVLRRSALAVLALSAFAKSLKPLAMIGATFLAGVVSASVILVLQLPGTIIELESPEVEREVLEKFGSVLTSASTVLQVCFGSHDLGALLFTIFAKSAGRPQLAIFTASVLIFLLITFLCISGVVCGVLLSQVIVQKGDAEVDGGIESFRKNQELVLSLNQVFENAGFSSSDNISWSDVLSVLAVDKAGQDTSDQSAWQYLLTAGSNEAKKEEDEEEDTERFRCILQDKGITMEELYEAYHEMALFGPVSVEDFILCTFKHVANIKTVSMLSFNHQQNKVFWRIQYHAQLVDDALHDMRFKIGNLHAALPAMIQEVEAASLELKELDALEARLELKKQALRNLIAEKEEGDLCYVEYHVDRGVVHTRLVLAQVENDEWIIATPDHDLYPELLSSENEDFRRFFHITNGSLPRGVNRNHIYAFQPMSAEEYARLISQGQRIAEAERNRRGLGAVPAVAVEVRGDAGGRPGDPSAAGVAGGECGEDDEVWILAEFVEGHRVGEEVAVPANAARDGKHALVHVTDSNGKDVVIRATRGKPEDLSEICEGIVKSARAMESKHGEDCLVSDDVRTLSIIYGANGERSRGFKESVQEMRQCEFSDFPLEPRTCHEYLKAVSEIAESCYGQHLAWVQQSKIPEGDRAIYEDEVLSKILDAAIKFDGYNVVNSLAFEMIVRRKQLLCEAHVGNPSQPSYEASDYFMGTRYRPGGGIVVPSLTEHVARKMHEESQVLKEKRKLKEVKGGGKGKGKYDAGKYDAPPKPDGGGPKK
eukprot:s689_g36.t1